MKEKPIKHLPGLHAMDLVAKIARARVNAKERRNRTRCFQTRSCDCKLCGRP